MSTSGANLGSSVDGVTRTTAIGGRHKKAYISIKGMSCAGCVMTTERLLREQPGVRAAEVSLASERGWISYDPLSTDLSRVVQSIDGFGYSARIIGDNQTEQRYEARPFSLLHLIASMAFGMQVMLLSLVHLYPSYAAGRFDSPDIRSVQYLAWVLTTPVLFYGGMTFLRGAIRAALARTATMDTLVSLGTISAYSYSVWFTINGGGAVYFDSIVMITVFVGLGKYVETLGGDQARKGIRSLLKLQPETARTMRESEWRTLPAAELAAGDKIMVRAGERVPADAEIAEGRGTLDESLLTGEPMPVVKAPGDHIYAGSMASDGVMICHVTRPPGDTRLARITALVEKTLETKPRVQRLADRVSAWFAFAVIAVAVAVLFTWWLSDHSLEHAFVSAVAVLVVACPCALGLATPFAISTALGRAAARGLLVRTPVALETAAKVARMVFDKTGTLTSGHMTVSDVRPARESGLSSAELLSTAAAIEQLSSHPLAIAIASAVPAMTTHQVGNFRSALGKGVSGTVTAAGDDRISIGTIDHIGATPPAYLVDQAGFLADDGRTIVWIGRKGIVLGFIALADETDPTAPLAITELSAIGLATVVLSGDSMKTVRALALGLQLQNFEASLTPEAKADHIREWQAAGECVGMVGDGVNDAPALAAADLSVAMGAGSDIAGQTADVILMSRNLELVPWFVAQSRKTRQVIQQNLFWAFSYNLLMIPLAAAGLINPMAAAGAMAISSLIVVGNSLR